MLMHYKRKRARCGRAFYSELPVRRGLSYSLTPEAMTEFTMYFCA